MEKEFTLGFIGLGVMGHSMAQHLIDAGYTLNLYNRTKSKADDLLCDRVRWCDSPAQVASRSDITFSIVGYPADVESIYLGQDGIASGILRTLPCGP